MPDDPRRASLPPEDLQFAELVVGQGLCSRQAVDECLSFLGRLIADGVTPLPRLGELLARRGFLNADQHHDATLKPAGAESDKPQDLPFDVAEAAADPANNLGKYVKIDRLGAGGMGEVWRGWDRELRRSVALKFLHYEDPGQLARFRREAQTAAALNHPHIASVYEVGEWKGKPFIAMQFIAGQTLDCVPRHAPRTLVELVRDAAVAIHYAHEQGVVHRDLKPANLMVDSFGATPRLFVMDFGLAKATAVDSSLSISGQVLGTPSYMAPEQASGQSARVGARSDVYALGATLYQLFADRPPFQESEVYALLRKVVDEDPVPLRRRNPDVDRDLETIVMKCLEKDPERRYATARTLGEDLDRWLAGEAIEAHPPSAGYKLRKFVARRKAILAVSTAGLAVAALLLAATLREKSEKEALRDLGGLRTKMLQVKEWTRQEFRSPAEVRAAMEQETARVSDFIARHPRLPQGYFVRAQGWMLQGRVDAAEKDLLEALRIDPRFGPGWSLLARAKLERYAVRLYGDPSANLDHLPDRAAPLLREAEEAFRKGSGGPLDAWGLSTLADDVVGDRLLEAFRHYYLKNEPDAAMRVLDEAFRSAPSEEYCRWLGAWSTVRADQLQWIEKAVRIAPHSATARSDLAGIRFIRGDWDGSIVEATKALDLNPRSAVAYGCRGAAWLQKRDWQRSVEDCSRAVDLDPQFAIPYATRSGARLNLGDYDAAIADATKAIDLDPIFPLAYSNRAGAKLSKGDSQGAIEDCDRALKLQPDLPMALANRSGAHLQLGDWDAALRDGDRAVERDPSLALGYVNRGSAKARKGDLDGGIADYARAIELNPNSALGYVNRAGLRLMQSRWDDAIRDCDLALAADPKMANAWSNRGAAKLYKGDSAGAIADATKAIDLGLALVEPYVIRGEARLGLREFVAAISDLETALKLAPATWPFRAEVEETLQKTRAVAEPYALIPPGRFLMGSPADEPGRKPDELQHEVTITKAFYLARREVTVGEFRKFVEATRYLTEVEKAGGGNAHDAKAVWTHTPGTSWQKPGPFTQTDDHPVVHVSHLDALAYCRWLNETAPRPGWTYGLPTEAEWEYACRGGTRGRYWWGDDPDASGKVVNAGDVSLMKVHPEWPRRIMPMDDGHAFTAPVGSYRPNAFGLHDMLGNVWEFCSTRHGPYPKEPSTDPGDLGTRESYDVRGGGWSNEPADLRCAVRNADPPKFGHSNLGFRVALHQR